MVEHPVIINAVGCTVGALAGPEVCAGAIATSYAMSTRNNINEYINGNVNADQLLGKQLLTAGVSVLGAAPGLPLLNSGTAALLEQSSIPVQLLVNGYLEAPDVAFGLFEPDRLLARATMITKRENGVFRNRLSDAVVWVLMAFATLYFLTSLVQDAERGKPVVLLALDALLMLGFLIPAIRYPLHGVIVSPTEVVVRNIMTTHKIAWKDIERFEVARHNPWPQVGVTVLRNGRRIPMTALQVALASKDAQRAVTDLNQQLSERMGLGDPPAKPSQAHLAT